MDDVGPEVVELTTQPRPWQAQDQFRIPGPERHSRDHDYAVSGEGRRRGFGRVGGGEHQRLVTEARQLLKGPDQAGDDAIDLG